jgi:hypothetical protein
VSTDDNLTRPHPLGSYGAGGQVPAQEDFRPDVLEELDPAAASLPVVEPVGTLQRLADTEPVRLLLRPVLVAVLGLLTVYGLVDESTSPAWVALVDAIVAVAGWLLIERVRGYVSPRRSVDDAVAEAVRRAQL